MEEFGGIVNFAEAVELVAHNIEQQTVVWLDCFYKVNSIGFVEFKHGNIGVNSSVQINFA